MSHTGLRFVKMDLHIHSPASHDFHPRSAEITPEAIVQEAISKDLRAIALTDHNSGEWIDSVKKAAEGTSLTIFPGVEILGTGGETGVHIIGIFDTDKDTNHITALLGRLQIQPELFGKKEAVSPMGPAEIIKEIASEQFGGIAILAHCTSSKGVLGEMKGEQRSRVFEELGLLGVEVNENDFVNEQKLKKGTRAVDFLDGKHKEYRCRKLGVYQASDNRNPTHSSSHGIGGIGTAFSYFKVESPVRLESLRQCLIDRDVRIRQPNEYNPKSFPWIKTVRINGGFFQDETFNFHEGLNSIIGSKGSGKSLIIECVRFAFGQLPTHSEIVEDHLSKLEHRLEQYGIVTIEYIDETGTPITFTRKYDVDAGNPVEGAVKEDLPRVFPILFLSQNEIIRIASIEEEQLNFIDKFFDFHEFTEKLRDIESGLTGLDADLSECFRAFVENKAVLAEIKTLDKSLSEINETLKSEVLSKIDNAGEKSQYFRLINQQVQDLVSELENASKKISHIEVPNVPEKISEDQFALQANKIASSIKEEIISRMQSLKVDAVSKASEIVKKHNAWLPQFDAIKKEYENFIRTKGGDIKAFEAKRKHSISRKELLVRKQTQLQGKVNQLPQVREKREKLLDDLIATYKSYSEARKLRCRKFEDESQEKLKVSISEASNTDAFLNSLKNFRTGTRIQEPDLISIANSISPKEFAASIIRYHLSDDPKFLKDVVDRSGLTEVKIKLLADHILEQRKYEEILSLQWNVPPQDRPEIRYQIASNNYELLKDVSVGQKCTAMLSMALSDGDMPVIIDQPEDSLDLKSIWSDMCRRLRKDKEERQFIFTTHNSSLAVASDTDNYLVLESTAHNGKISERGAIDLPEIRKEVINYLEGGEETYLHKYTKYNVRKKNEK